MATVSDITTTPLSGLNHIDALLDIGPDWNYLTSAAENTIHYTFSVASGNEAGQSGQETFTLAQQVATRTAFSYLADITGINFVETAIGTNAQIHLANIDLPNANTTGLCSWKSSYAYGAGNALTSYSADAYVYLDKVEWRAQSLDLKPGGVGYQTLLHELGHALGLGHPFHEANEGDHVHLPVLQDNTSNTLMSYTDIGGPFTTFSPYDLAALNWLYGGDGLRGALGINSTSGARYMTGTARGETLTGTRHDDTLQGNGGNDMIDGGEGTDTAVFNGSRSAYKLSNQADGSLTVTSASEGSTNLRSVEVLRFADMSVVRANLSDTTAPPAPVMTVMQNPNRYAVGDKPLMSGSAEANSTVRVYIDNALVATTKAGADGLWSVLSSLKLPDRLNYSAHATATDESGNTSPLSATIVFHVDVTAPVSPAIELSMATGGNQPVFAGSGEAGTRIELYRSGDMIKLGEVAVGSDGRWQFASKPLPDGSYTVIAASVDLAGNATSSSNTVAALVNNPANKLGTANADTFVMGPENAAISGGNGIDIAVFSGKHADYKIAQGSYGWAVSDRNGGVDGLYNVERLQFSDSWYAIDEPTAQLFRLYRAALGREAEPTGLGYWMDRVDNGTSLLQIAHEFSWAPEFKEKYGTNPTDEVFISRLYANVLNRQPDANGYAYWLTRVDDSSREQIMLEFTDSLENQAQVLAQTSDGIEFTPWKAPVKIVGSEPLSVSELPFA